MFYKIPASKVAKIILAVIILSQISMFAYSGNQVQASADSTPQYSFQTDLNGDKKKEQISFLYSGEEQLLTITVNGKSISYNDFYLDLYTLDETTVEDCMKNRIKTIDLNRKDKFKEVLFDLHDTYSKSDSLLFSYDTAPKKMGIFKKLSFNGNGAISEKFMYDNYPLTYFYEKKFKLNSKYQLEEIKPYYYKPDHNFTLAAQKDIAVYNRNKVTNIGTIKKDEAVTFLGGDNSQWILIKKSNGIAGWVKISNPGTLYDYFDIAIPDYTFQTDLDGDKKDDKIIFHYNNRNELLKITINGESITYNDFFLPLRSSDGPNAYEGVAGLGMCQISTIDLDKKDKFIEICIVIHPDFGPDTSILVCYDKAPQKMGQFHSMSYEGNGKITESTLTQFPGNYFCSKRYALNSKHQLEETKPDYYKIGEDYSLTAKKQMDIYEKDKVTIIGTIKQDEAVKFLGGDDLQWMVLQKSDGIVGWVKIPEPEKVLEYFSGLENMRIVY